MICWSVTEQQCSNCPVVSFSITRAFMIVFPVEDIQDIVYLSHISDECFVQSSITGVCRQNLITVSLRDNEKIHYTKLHRILLLPFSGYDCLLMSHSIVGRLWKTLTLTLIYPASMWMHWFIPRHHFDLFRAATSASSQVSPILDKSLLTCSSSLYGTWTTWNSFEHLNLPMRLRTSRTKPSSI